LLRVGEVDALRRPAFHPAKNASPTKRRMIDDAIGHALSNARINFDRAASFISATVIGIRSAWAILPSSSSGTTCR
jgi:hypothetical protein